MRINETAAEFPPCQRGRAIEVKVNGQKVPAYEGELVSTILLEHGLTAFGHKLKTGRESGLYCGMGICYQCLVRIDGVENIRACHTAATDQMVIETTQENP